MKLYKYRLFGGQVVQEELDVEEREKAYKNLKPFGVPKMIRKTDVGRVLLSEPAVYLAKEDLDAAVSVFLIELDVERQSLLKTLKRIEETIGFLKKQKGNANE